MLLVLAMLLVSSMPSMPSVSSVMSAMSTSYLSLHVLLGCLMSYGRCRARSRRQLFFSKSP